MPKAFPQPKKVQLPNRQIPTFPISQARQKFDSLICLLIQTLIPKNKLNMLIQANFDENDQFSDMQTPLKAIVPHEINSWAETHQKKGVIYRFKNKGQDQIRKYINRHKQSNVPSGIKNTLAVLKAYKENLLKSTAKKIAERELPPITAIKMHSQTLTKTKRSPQQGLKSATQLHKGEQSYKAINITQFQPNIENISNNIQTLEVIFPISNPQKCQKLRQVRKTLIKSLQRNSKNRIIAISKEKPLMALLRGANEAAHKQNLIISRRLMSSRM